MAHYCSLAVFHLFYLLGVSHLVEAELLRYLRAHLCRVAVDSLTATNDKVNVEHVLVYFLNGL